MAGRLDLVPAALAGPSRAWYFLPLCALLSCIATLLRRTWCCTVLGLVIGAAAIGLVIAVVRSPLGVGIGAQVAALTGLLSIAGALMVMAGSWGRRRDGRDEPVGGA